MTALTSHQIRQAAHNVKTPLVTPGARVFVALGHVKHSTNEKRAGAGGFLNVVADNIAVATCTS